MSHQDFADHCILGLTHVAQQSLREKLRLLPPAPSADLLPPAHLCEVPPQPPPPMYAANPPLLLDYPSADAPHPDWLLPYAAASRYQDLQFPHLYPLDVPPQLLHHHPPFPDPLGQGAACEPSATQGLTLSLASTLPHEPLGLLSELVPSAAKHCAIGPLGPFTGYATILQNSKFLRPAQQLLDECCTPATSLLHSNKPPGLAAFGRGLASDAAASSSRCSFEGVGDSGGLHRHEIQERKAKLLVLQGEVCRRYKQYNQQIQMAISSFESVAGLSGAIPFMSAAVKTVSRHFRFLKHVISEQVLQISRALGEEISSYPSLSNSERATSSRSKFLEQTLRRQKAEENGLVAMENSQPIWRPQRGLPERAVAVLRAWLFDHFLHPYPTDTDKLMLAQQTGLSRNQVSNWFINARVRVWKPMVEEIHMLETKGSAEKDLSSSTRNEASQRSVADQDHEVQPDQQSGNFSHLSQVEPSQLESNPHCQSIGQWPMEKQRLGMEGCSSGADVTGQFADLSAYHGGIQMGGLGSVSLTLGLRQDDGAWQQQYQQMRPYFGSQMIND